MWWKLKREDGVKVMRERKEKQIGKGGAEEKVDDEKEEEQDGEDVIMMMMKML